jgi:hypothetical protein
MLQYWLHVICDTLCYAFSQTDFTFEASATRRTAMQQLLLVILLIDGSTRAYSSWSANSNGLMAEIFIVLTGVQGSYPNSRCFGLVSYCPASFAARYSLLICSPPYIPYLEVFYPVSTGALAPCTVALVSVPIPRGFVFSSQSCP